LRQVKRINFYGFRATTDCRTRTTGRRWWKIAPRSRKSIPVTMHIIEIVLKYWYYNNNDIVVITNFDRSEGANKRGSDGNAKGKFFSPFPSSGRLSFAKPRCILYHLPRLPCFWEIKDFSPSVVYNIILCGHGRSVQSAAVLIDEKSRINNHETRYYFVEY